MSPPTAFGTRQSGGGGYNGARSSYQKSESGMTRQTMHANIPAVGGTDERQGAADRKQRSEQETRGTGQDKRLLGGDASPSLQLFTLSLSKQQSPHFREKQPTHPPSRNANRRCSPPPGLRQPRHYQPHLQARSKTLHSALSAPPKSLGGKPLRGPTLAWLGGSPAQAITKVPAGPSSSARRPAAPPLSPAASAAAGISSSPPIVPTPLRDTARPRLPRFSSPQKSQS